MTVDAPQDRQSAVARINWLVRQLSKVQRTDIFVRVIWPTRAQDLVCRLLDLRADVKTCIQGQNQIPRAFEVFLVSGDSRRFSGRNKFIEQLEHAVPAFYDEVGQHLERWRAKAPKPIEPTKEEVVASSHDAAPAPVEEEPKKNNEPANLPTTQGNRHTDLLEIPSFLRRIYE